MIYDLWFLIIATIVDAGGDIATGFFPGYFALIAKTFELRSDTVVNL